MPYPVSVSNVPEAVAAYLERQHVKASAVVPLTGDASDRRYFRVHPVQESPFVVALHSGPFDFRSLPFANVAALFALIPVPIPRILGHADDLGVLAVDDLGDVTLQAHLGAVPSTDWLAWYHRAAEIIRLLQRRGAELASDRFVPYGLAFDEEKLTWEMDFFLKHFLEGYRQVTLTAAERAALREELVRMVRELAAEPRVLCHRDYHSRNLMVKAGQLFVIDFQDARLGPDTYDLVSLLRDSYVELPEPLVEAVIATYLGSTKADISFEFRRRFDLMAVQRTMKALGTFGYQTNVRGNPVYLQYVPRTLRYVRQNLQKYDRFSRLHELLGSHLEELRA